MKKLIITTILVLVLCISSVTTGLASAQPNAQPINNLDESSKIIEVTNDSVVYTYEESGKFYKVILKHNLNRTELHSDVYLKNKDGEYEFLRSSDLDVKDDSALLTITEDEEVKSFPVGEEKFSAQEKIPSENEEVSLFTAANYEQLGPWAYSFTSNIREDVKGMTRDAITATLFGIYWWPAGAAATAAGLVMAAVSDAFWIKEDIWYKRIKGTSLAKGEWTVTNIYADKANKYHLSGPNNHIVYVKGWEP